MGGSFSLPLRVSIVLTVQQEWKGRLQNLLGNSKQTLSCEPLEIEKQVPHSQDKIDGYRRVISIAKGKRGAIARKGGTKARTKHSRTNIQPMVPRTASGDTRAVTCLECSQTGAVAACSLTLSLAVKRTLWQDGYKRT